MRFNSKSLLSTIPMGPLEFECRNLADIYKANGYLPDDLPVVYLGGGCFGKAYGLLNFPGLVIKLCNREDDAFPEYIRRLAVLPKTPAWAPVVFTYGGDETRDVFWCVMPEYASCEHGELGHGMYEKMAGVMGTRWSGPLRAWPESPRAVKRDTRSMDKILRAMAEDIYGEFDLDIHSGNFMYDTARKRVVFTDPFGYMCITQKSVGQDAHS